MPTQPTRFTKAFEPVTVRASCSASWTLSLPLAIQHEPIPSRISPVLEEEPRASARAVLEEEPRASARAVVRDLLWSSLAEHRAG